MIFEFSKALFKSLLTKENKQHLITNQEPLNEDKYEEITKQINCKNKSRNKLSQLDNYCIFLASKWLDTIDDHINLIQVSKRLQLNMEKFFFNPVSINTITREFFPYLQTLYRYSRDSDLFEEEIAKYTVERPKYDDPEDDIEESETVV